MAASESPPSEASPKVEPLSNHGVRLPLVLSGVATTIAVVALVASVLAVSGALTPASSSPTVLWASVASNGTVVQGHGATNTTHPVTGVYDVYFDRNVTNCTVVASPTAIGSSTDAIIVATPGFIGRVSEVSAVIFLSTNGSLIDNPFNLVVIC